MHETRMLSIISNCVEAIESPKEYLKKLYKKRKTPRRQMKMKEMN